VPPAEYADAVHGYYGGSFHGESGASGEGAEYAGEFGVAVVVVVLGAAAGAAAGELVIHRAPLACGPVPVNPLSRLI